MKLRNRELTKEKLEESSREYQEALEHDLDSLLDKSKKILTGAVVVGLGFWVAYRIFKSLNSDVTEEDSKPEHASSNIEKEPSVFSIVRQTVMKELAMFLLGILKEKIVEHLQGLGTDENDS